MSPTVPEASGTVLGVFASGSLRDSSPGWLVAILLTVVIAMFLVRVWRFFKR